MRKTLGLLGLGVCVVGVACSAGKAPSNAGRSDANGGSLALSGSGGGTGVTAGTGTGATGGSLVLTDSGGGGPMSGSGGELIDTGPCATLSVQTVEVVPTVDLLVDTSGSMFQQPAPFWGPLSNALLDPTGVVKQLQDKVRFGFTSFTGMGTGAMCPLLKKVPYALNNYDAINAVYGAIAATYNGQKWETPTHAAVDAAAADLAAFVPVPPGPKFILLVTDGSPDTCWANDPQCGQDASIKAVQDANAKGITTYVLGIGDILDPAADGCSAGRCGKDYLQDIANAGTGQPVEPTTDNNYQYSGCVANSPTKALVAAYAATGGGAAAPYYTVSGSGTTSDVAPLVTAIKQALLQTRSCTFAMTATLPTGMTTGVKITTNAEKGVFSYNGTPLTYNDPNGWTLSADQTGITLSGSVCDSWKTAGGTLTGSFPCEVTFDPVPPPPPPR
jgi:von Willebrand factor type A domain